jgi:hypothetical protein
MSRMSRPGFFASSAAPIILTRSITRLRFGAPGAEKCRERCSRLTPTSLASTAVRTGRPADPRTERQVASCISVLRPSDCGGVASAFTNRDVKVRGATRSLATGSSIPSARMSQNSSAAHLATAGASVARSGVIPKNGALGNSCASDPIFQVSSLVADPDENALDPVASPPALVDAAGDPTSISAASISIVRNTALNSDTSRAITIRHRRFGNAVRTNARARSRGVYASSVGSSSASATTLLDTRFYQLDVGLSLDELAHDRVACVLNLVDRSYLADFSLIQHRDA